MASYTNPSMTPKPPASTTPSPAAPSKGAPGGPIQLGVAAVRREASAAASRKKGLGNGLSHLKDSGYTSFGATITAPPKEQAAEALAACGIDATLAELDMTYHKKDFSLLEIQTNKEKMRVIMDPTYKLLTDDLKSLSVKHVSLSDAIRVLDEPRPDYDRLRTQQIKKEALPDLETFAAQMMRANAAAGSVSTKYFSKYSVDSPRRLAKIPFASKIKSTAIVYTTEYGG